MSSGQPSRRKQTRAKPDAAKRRTVKDRILEDVRGYYNEGPVFGFELEKRARAYGTTPSSVTARARELANASKDNLLRKDYTRDGHVWYATHDRFEAAHELAEGRARHMCSGGAQATGQHPPGPGDAGRPGPAVGAPSSTSSSSRLSSNREPWGREQLSLGGM